MFILEGGSVFECFIGKGAFWVYYLWLFTYLKVFMGVLADHDCVSTLLWLIWGYKRFNDEKVQKRLKCLLKN